MRNDSILLGDGAGILMQMPHSFFSREFLKEGITLPEEGSYGMAVLFLPQDDKERKICEETFSRIVKEEGLSILGWRTIPVDNSMIGKTAKECEPVMKQVDSSSDPDNQVRKYKHY